MKNILLLINLFTIMAFSQTPCVNGFAGQYPCNNLDLLSNFPISTFNADKGNECWGWTDPQTNKEYAIFCTTHNTAFIDITDPINPIYLGKLNSHAGTNIWRDVKVYQNYAFIVADNSGDHGMQIFDLTRLRSIANPPEIFTEDAHFDGFMTSHNIVINEDTGYAYSVGGETYNGGPHFINIQDPLNPIDEGGYANEGGTHDAQVVTYHGPDTEHQGKEIFVGYNVSSVVVVDVTNKNNPITLSNFTYPNIRIAHQGWFDDVHKYIYLNDEGDESNFGINTRAIVFDMTDLDNPVLQMEYFGNTGSIDHNYYVKEDKLYLANYTSGIRIVDIADVANQNMNEIAFFDSFPANNNVNFDGVWSVYPFFESGNILISDRNNGLFVVRDSNSPLGISNNTIGLTSIYPNPANNILNIQSNQTNISKIEVFDVLGKRVLINEDLKDINNYKLDIANLKKGFYFVKVNNLAVRKFIKK